MPDKADGTTTLVLGADVNGEGKITTQVLQITGGSDLSEQFDQRTGEQTSAKHLAWSYAAFISCVTARRAVLSP